MNRIRKDDLKDLVAAHQPPCVSLYMPTHHAGRKEVEQDPIRFKNLVRQAQNDLVAAGMRLPEARNLIDRAASLSENWAFWNHQSDGLAMFLSRDTFLHFRVPFRFEEQVMVGDRFSIKPLVPLITNDGKFYILAISMDRVRVLEGTRDSISELHLDTVPGSLEEALRFNDSEKQLQFHTEAPRRGATGRRDAVFFGTGAGDPDIKNAILRYLQKVDRGLHDLLNTEQAPLVLAGVEYVFPIFREASHYRNIIDGIPGNPDTTPAPELHHKAWELVRPHFAVAQVEAAERFRSLNAMGSPLASASLNAVVPAAFHGRVDTLFVPRQGRRFGDFDPSSATVQVSEGDRNGHQDLLDLATAHTLVNGGAIYAVEQPAMPDGGEVAAIFRY